MITLSTYASLHNICYQSAFNRAKAWLIPGATRWPNGRWLLPEQDVKLKTVFFYRAYSPEKEKEATDYADFNLPKDVIHIKDQRFVWEKSNSIHEILTDRTIQRLVIYSNVCVQPDILDLIVKKRRVTVTICKKLDPIVELKKEIESVPLN